MKTEKVVACIFLGGLVFKLMHWPGGGPLIVLSLTVLFIFYFAFAFYFFCDKQIKRQNLALSIISGIFLSTVPIGLMFKFQYWPGAQVMLLPGLFTTPIFLIIILFLQKKSAEDLIVYYKNMFARTLVLSILSIVMYFTPISTLVKIQYSDNPEFVKIATNHYENPYDKDYTRQYNEYLVKWDSIHSQN